MFARLRKTNIKLLLLTNSEYYYTDKVMSYLLNDQDPDFPSWRDYFGVYWH
jgi:hypothetical protein